MKELSCYSCRLEEYNNQRKRRRLTDSPSRRRPYQALSPTNKQQAYKELLKKHWNRSAYSKKIMQDKKMEKKHGD